MSPRHTRKSFFAKLVGLGAAFGIAPKLLGKSILPSGQKAAAPHVPFAVRTDQRTVSRSRGSL